VASDLLSTFGVAGRTNSASEEENVSDLKNMSWLELCQAASREEDPETLLELVTALNDLLEERELEEKARQCAFDMTWSARRFGSNSSDSAAA
jgi:hypothetical protein